MNNLNERYFSFVCRDIFRVTEPVTLNLTNEINRKFQQPIHELYKFLGIHSITACIQRCMQFFGYMEEKKGGRSDDKHTFLVEMKLFRMVWMGMKY